MSHQKSCFTSGSLVIRKEPIGNFEFDQVMEVIEMYDLPPVLKCKSLVGDKIYDRLFPFSYRGATKEEMDETYKILKNKLC